MWLLNVYLVAKTNRFNTLLFTVYTGVYYIAAVTEVLNHNVPPVPGLCHTPPLPIFVGTNLIFCS